MSTENPVYVAPYDEFQEFLGLMKIDPEFARINQDLLNAFESGDPEKIRNGVWLHTEWFKELGHTRVSDAAWDWMDGRR